MTIETARKTNVTAEWNPQKPRPNIDVDNVDFWDGLRREELLLWTCRTCGAAYWPKCYCIEHENEPFAANMSWEPSSGLGRIFAMNRHHTAFNPGFADEIPYTYALVELDEGPMISSTIVGDPPNDLLAVGLRVRVVYKHYPAEGFTLPHFEVIGE
ncbi:MAG: hypothetical protein GEV28_17585 [Actinophytocola sp.]|uniref:Zn-ribbon domain-containing OB-fold protein n=1 Tax=Actinophytocola sp. TaxID=1872138 RepID=UPI0013207910|nr:OB-fold domain-containing protein [Actinophytocola sp.]MPZ82101.1 hypothetical protein [Actinophytocola sp.]